MSRLIFGYSLIGYDDSASKPFFSRREAEEWRVYFLNFGEA